MMYPVVGGYNLCDFAGRVGRLNTDMHSIVLEVDPFTIGFRHWEVPFR